MSRHRREKVRLGKALPELAPINVNKALGVSRIADMDLVTKLRQVIDKPRGQALDLRPRDAFLATEETPEQKEMKACGRHLKAIAADNPDINALIATMTAARRCYIIAYQELNAALEEAAAKNGNPVDPVPATIKDYAAQIAMYVATKPFSEHDVVKGMIEVVMPVLATIVDRHTVSEEEEAKQELAKANDERRSSPIPIDLKHTPMQDDTNLLRQGGLIFLGWRNAVCWLLDKISTTVVNQKFGVLRFCSRTVKPDEQQAGYLQIDQGIWHGSTNNIKTFERMVHEYLIPMQSGPVDLVMCDDVAYAHTGGFVGRLAAARAGDAYRLLEKWCKQMGAGFVGALPLPDWTLPEQGGQEFEQLKMFSTFRPVQVMDGSSVGKDDCYRLIVGSNASVFDVPKSDLDAYSARNILVPGGLV